MAAYASLVSLETVIDHLQNHPRPPITFEKEQIESLCKNINFFQDFLESCPHRVIKRAADGFESRMAEVAHSAEDAIESHIVDHIRGESTSAAKEIRTMEHLYQTLQKVVQEFGSLKDEVKQIKKTTLIQDHHHLLPLAVLGSSTSRAQNKIHMVGFDDVLLQVLDKLTGHESSLQIIPIVGMGGIGKTTLAKNAFENQLIVEHFQIRSWTTVSQEYNMRNVLLEILSSLKHKVVSNKNLSEMSAQELGENLHKILWGRKYLVVMDDIWSIEVWDTVRRYLPNNNSGSRIIMTSRMSNISHQVSGSQYCLKLSFLDQENSWDLLCKNVFPEEVCPAELEQVGRGIVKSCKGLPLSIVVISGLLVRSPRTRECWEYVAQNLTSIVNTENDKQCSKILGLSYNHLPVHLKPCFLYMAIYPEDSSIKASTLIKLWVAEGFLKPRAGDNLKTVAEEYLKEFIDRNLISVKLLGYNGRVKYCQMHDLLRDFCIKIAVKENFIHFFRKNNLNVLQGFNAPRRIVYNGLKSERDGLSEILSTFQTSSCARSLIADDDGDVSEILFRLLRVLILGGSSYDHRRLVGCSLSVIVQLVNSRFISLNAKAMTIGFSIPSSLCLIWNLRTIRISSESFHCFHMPPEIWMMPQLEHFKIYYFYLPDPPQSEDYGLWNLQTLSYVERFNCSEEMVERIPNIRKLKIVLREEPYNISCSDYCMNNLGHLSKLESLYLENRIMISEQDSLLQGLNLMHFLRKLSLRGTELDWEDITRVIGSLPRLEVLILFYRATQGSVWSLEEGKFSRLKVLKISKCYNLRHWMADSTHFPCLEHIDLFRVKYLEEIPLGIGDIPVLRLIEVVSCSTSAKISAKKIQEEQEQLGNLDLEIKIY